MNIELALIDQQVQGIVKQYKEKLDLDKNKAISKAFLFLTIKTLFELEDEEEVFESIYDGGNDYAIDGLYVSDVVNDTFSIKIIQTKYKRFLKDNGEYYNGDSKFPRNDIVKMLNSLSLILDPYKNTTNLSSRLATKIAEIKDLIQNGIIPSVDIFMCNNGLKWDDESENIIKEANLPDWITFHHINHKDIVNLLRDKETIDDRIEFKGKIIVEDFNYARVLIGKVNVKEFYRIFNQHGDKLLEKNVRKYLGVKNRVNEAIKESLLKEDNSNFFFLNNGITMIVSDFSYNAMQDKDFTIQLKDINIINGGQTCKTIEETIKDNPTLNFDNAYVLVRVYKLSPEQEKIINEITYATNSQTAINLRDLKANDEIQKNLIEAVAKLELDKNNNPVYSYKPKRDAVVSRNAISITVAAEAILSVWIRKPHVVKFRKNRMFEDSYYNEIFNHSLNASKLVLAVLIWRFVETKRKTAKNELYIKYPFLGYASNIVSMIIGDLLIKDIGINREQISHTNFIRLKNIFEEKKEIYYEKAMNMIKEEIESDKIKINIKLDSLQRIAGVFRGGYLTQNIIKRLDNAER